MASDGKQVKVFMFDGVKQAEEQLQAWLDGEGDKINIEQIIQDFSTTGNAYSLNVRILITVIYTNKAI